MRAYPLLYDVYQMLEITFKHGAQRKFELPFRRRLYQKLGAQGEFIVEKAKNIPLSNAEDSVFWKLTANKKFRQKLTIHFWS